MAARHEIPREDLLRDAVQYVDRVEFLLPRWVEPVFVGFRPNGAASIYLGQDHVLQFNVHGAIRRVFWEGSLYRADNGRLVHIQRDREGARLRCRRECLSCDEQQRLLTMFANALEELTQVLKQPDVRIRGQVHQSQQPAAERLHDWLASRPNPLTVANSPGAAAL